MIENSNQTVADQINETRTVRETGGDTVQETTDRTTVYAAQAEDAPQRTAAWKKALLILLLAVITLGGIAFCTMRRTAPNKTVTLEPVPVKPPSDSTQLVENLVPPQAPTPLPTPGDPTLGGIVNPAANNPSGSFQTGGIDPNSPVTTKPPQPQVVQATTTTAPGQQTGNAGGNSGGGNGDNSSNGGNDSAPRIDEDRPTGKTAADTRAIFFRSSRNSSAPRTVSRSVLPNSDGFPEGGESEAVKRVPFGTQLPVRTLGAVHSLLRNSLARFELTREVRGNGWYLPAGTVIVAKQSQAAGNRMFFSPEGFIYKNRFYPLQGEVSGMDGAAGLKGERKQIGSQWYKVALDLASRAQTTLNAWLAGRGGGNVSSTNVQLPDTSGLISTNQSNVVKYVVVPPMTEGYLLVTFLPESADNVNLPNETSSEEPEITPGVKLSRAENALGSGDTNQMQRLLKP